MVFMGDGDDDIILSDLTFSRMDFFFCEVGCKNAAWLLKCKKVWLFPKKRRGGSSEERCEENKEPRWKSNLGNTHTLKPTSQRLKSSSPSRYCPHHEHRHFYEQQIHPLENKIIPDDTSPKLYIRTVCIREWLVWPLREHNVWSSWHWGPVAGWG